MRSVFFGVFQSFVVLLYILDNETNFVVQVSVFIGVLIDLWKITKVMDVRVSQAPCCCGACRVGRGRLHSQALPWSLGVSRRQPGSQDLGDFRSRGFFWGHIRAGELGRVRKGRGRFWLGSGGSQVPTDLNLLPGYSWTGSTEWQESSPAQPSKTSPPTLSLQPKYMMM